MNPVIFKKITVKEIELRLAIGTKIMTWREAQRLTKGRLSKLTGIPYGRLFRIEIGETDISILTLCKIMQILKVDVKDSFPAPSLNEPLSKAEDVAVG